VNNEGIEVAHDPCADKGSDGLNASAGISYCEFLTKIASDLNKPNAQAVITPRMGPIFVEALPRAQTSHRFKSLPRVCSLAPRLLQVPGTAATPDRIFRPQHCVSSAP
jgi:hypothetical protein